LCTAVFSYLVVACSNFETAPSSAGIFAANFSLLEWYWSVMIVVLASKIACISRVYLGVHYPSDCLAGLCFAGLILLASAGLYQIPLFDCKSCAEDCSSDSHINQIADLNWVPISVVLGVGTIASFVITMKPIAFWKKNAYVFG
jgi:hypothetical protein